MDKSKLRWKQIMTATTSQLVFVSRRSVPKWFGFYTTTTVHRGCPGNEILGAATRSISTRKQIQLTLKEKCHLHQLNVSHQRRLLSAICAARTNGDGSLTILTSSDFVDENNVHDKDCMPLVDSEVIKRSVVDHMRSVPLRGRSLLLNGNHSQYRYNNAHPISLQQRCVSTAPGECGQHKCPKVRL